MYQPTVTAVLLLIFFGGIPRTGFTQSVASAPEQTPTKVYLLGTFHFAQMDSTYDVLEERHQKSLDKVADLILKNMPEKVFVERQPEYEFQNKVNARYAAYLKSDTLKGRNEIWQLGFRIAKRAGHKRVYQCDHPGQYGNYFRAVKDYANNHGQLGILRATTVGTVPRHDDLVNEDSLRQNSTLLEYLQWINSPPVMNTSHASYLTNYPQIGSKDFYNYDDDDTLIGAELTADWYWRNIMIYTKIINQLDYSEKAIFLLIGADHVPIISNLFRGNPHFTVIEPAHWLY